jgi:hypothetical protein
MVLRDAAGTVVDSLNYGGLVDPWSAEGYQAASGAGASGCSVPSPGGARGAQAASALHRSAGRFPDGADSDSNCADFQLQSTATLAMNSDVGLKNIKVNSVAGFTVGQTIFIDSGENRETAVIATIGTPGATAVSTGTSAGVTVIPVTSAAGFSAGQTITIDNGTNRETAVVASVNGGRRGGGGGGGRGPAGASITITAPLAMPHGADAQVSGSGITVVSALTRAHASGAQIAGNLPTPGAPNQYSRRN